MSNKNNDNKEDIRNPFVVNTDTENSEEEKEENIEENTMQDENSTCDNYNKLQEKYDVLNNQYIRLAADFDNFRKRQMQERESLLKYGAENTLKLILPVLDNYERGKKSCETIEDAKQLKDSFEVIFKQFFDVLDKAGLKKIETKDKTFDPNIHEAVMQTPTSEYPDQTIIEELQAGYMLEDRVLRPALVNVAVGE